MMMGDSDPAPCPLCGAHTTTATIEGHLARRHPEHHVHLFGPVPLCPHSAFTLGMFHGPALEQPSWSPPMMVN